MRSGPINHNGSSPDQYCKREKPNRILCQPLLRYRFQLSHPYKKKLWYSKVTATTKTAKGRNGRIACLLTEDIWSDIFQPISSERIIPRMEKVAMTFGKTHVIGVQGTSLVPNRFQPKPNGSETTTGMYDQLTKNNVRPNPIQSMIPRGISAYP